MPRFRLSGRRFWSNRRRRRSTTNNESTQEESSSNSTATQQNITPEAILSEPLINTVNSSNVDDSIQRASTDPPPIIIDDASTDIITANPPQTSETDDRNMMEHDYTNSQTYTRDTISSQDPPVTTNNHEEPSHNCTVRQASTAHYSNTTVRRSSNNVQSTVGSTSQHTIESNTSLIQPSQGTTEFTFDGPPPTPPRGTLTHIPSRLLAIYPSSDNGDTPNNSSTTTTQQCGAAEVGTLGRRRTSNNSPPSVVTVLLRESEGEAHYSRLLGATVRSPLVHTPRRYHFIWSSDGTDNNLWASPIRLRSYLSQFCTAVSRRVIPHGASIEVVLYPNLLTTATAPGFVPMSITRLYCMIHPIHPPTSWQTQFPTDFAGNWSSYISDIGMNALAGPLLEAPIPTSLPDPTGSPTPSPPSYPIPDHSNTANTSVVETPIVPHYSQSSSISQVSLPLSELSSRHSLADTQSTNSTEDYEDEEEEEDNNGTSLETTLSPRSPPPLSSSSLRQTHPSTQLPTSPSLDRTSSQGNLPFRFPYLPNRGLHEYNLFVPPSYILGPVIGEGEFAKVRMACNLVTNGAVAIKAFRKRRGGLTSSIDEQIVREINVIKGLRCRNIVKFFESLVHGDRVFMVMEIMTKGDLRKYINKTGAMKETNARKMFSDILNGVSYLHQNHIVHLDLKLENLLLNEELVVKITDFGCARFQVGTKRFSTPCGSYAYGAPEVISGQSYDGIAADMWSVGEYMYM